jgi:2-methylisocitrate lyase-like PEP mutase family enzyme
MNETQRDKAERFLARHRESGCFLMPNAWDSGSAKMLESVSPFRCLSTPI